MDTVGLTASTLPFQGRPVPKVFLHREIPQIFWVWHPKGNAAWCDSQRLTTSAPNSHLDWDHGGSQAGCPGAGQVSVVLIKRPFCLCFPLSFIFLRSLWQGWNNTIKLLSQQQANLSELLAKAAENEHTSQSPYSWEWTDNFPGFSKITMCIHLSLVVADIVCIWHKLMFWALLRGGVWLAEMGHLGGWPLYCWLVPPCDEVHCTLPVTMSSAMTYFPAWRVATLWDCDPKGTLRPCSARHCVTAAREVKPTAGLHPDHEDELSLFKMSLLKETNNGHMTLSVPLQLHVSIRLNRLFKKFTPAKLRKDFSLCTVCMHANLVRVRR